MSHVVWRIAADTATYPADDLSGNGARATGGRWNARGQAVVYASTTRALACLETVVHLNAGGLPLNRYLVEISIPAAVWKAARRETAGGLPVGWDAEPASLTSVGFGGAWVAGMRSAVLVVPSVVVPEEFNVLINPGHPGAEGIACRKVRKWVFDGRLLQGR
ncbi:MAG: RES family NAD+ phosphorylase [Acetobacteraceae bacterium]|nr:RES family NAD+ phosphorylase [Acetobacteraceae bacterium]